MASYRHKKQSGGAGQFGEVYLKIEPYHDGMPEPHEHHVRDKEVLDLPWGGKLVFYNCIVGGVIDQRFIPSIQKGIMEKMHERSGDGLLRARHPRDRVRRQDASRRLNDISFKIAGMMAFKEAFHQAEPRILEPVYEIEVMVPEELMGDVVTDLQGRRSIILGMDSKGKYQVIKARAPGGTRQVFYLPYAPSHRAAAATRKIPRVRARPGEIQRQTRRRIQGDGAALILC